jgi:hypothetical protein
VTGGCFIVYNKLLESMSWQAAESLAPAGGGGLVGRGQPQTNGGPGKG